MTTSHRISVTLDAADEAVLSRFADPERPEHNTLTSWADEHNLPVRDSSDAAILRILARVGAETLLEQALEEGYTKLAAEMSAEDLAEGRAQLTRYARRTDRYAE